MVPHPQADKRKIVFLFSDTGGGHRSACEAIIEAINLEFPGQFDTEMVDIFRQYAPRPLDMAPNIYPTLSRMPEVWRLGYRASDGKRRTRALTRLFWPYVRRSLTRLVLEHPCDLLVSVHQLSNAPFARVLQELEKIGHPHTPFAIVVTDMVSTHAFWYDNRARLVIVPTEAARRRGIEAGLDSGKIRVVGMPVGERFAAPLESRATLREKLGWAQDRLAVLMVGGGEGMGPLEPMAEAADEAGLPISIAVIAGRNQKLRERLEGRRWQTPHHIYGFVKNMPELMGAADVLVTKAGPGTISEAFIAGLPILLYSRMPGQEDGNVRYVVQQGAGAWTPEPERMAAVLREWVEHPEKLHAAAAASRRLAHPHASREIARLLVEQIDPVKLSRSNRTESV
ncbi:MAG TPA: glycosyltransferase [Anaerolineaceae bacterium]